MIIHFWPPYLALVTDMILLFPSIYVLNSINFHFFSFCILSISMFTLWINFYMEIVNSVWNRLTFFFWYLIVYFVDLQSPLTLAFLNNFCFIFIIILNIHDICLYLYIFDKRTGCLNVVYKISSLRIVSFC